MDKRAASEKGITTMEWKHSDGKKWYGNMWIAPSDAASILTEAIERWIETSEGDASNWEEQRDRLKNRLAGRPRPSRDIFKDCGSPMLDEDAPGI